jgi:hypothetical protein
VFEEAIFDRLEKRLGAQGTVSGSTRTIDMNFAMGFNATE